MFTKKEIFGLVISTIILAFVFGFDDGNKVFVLSSWMKNFFGFILIIIVSLLFRELILKIFASRHEADSEYEIWNIRRFYFGEEGKLPAGFPFGLLLSIILALGSGGKLFFTAIGIHNIKENSTARTGRKFPALNYFEEAQIVSMGIMASLFLAVAAVLAGKILNVDMSAFVTVNFFLALFNLIPVSTLDGAKIFFGSLLMYIFILVFIVVSFLLIKGNPFLGLIIGFLSAVLVTFIYFFYFGK